MFYRRNLPHWQPGTAALFITTHVAGSLPTSAACQLRAMREDGDGTLDSARRLFQWYEHSLDRGPDTARPFTDPAAADLVQDAILAEDGVSCRLLAWVVMPNHLHLLAGPLPDKPLEPSAELMRRIKGRSSREVNLLHGRNGRLWQPESFDRWMRDDGNLENTVAYIERNPVAAGLCREARLWRWSSAGRPDGSDAG